MELTFLLLSLAVGVQSWPQIPNEMGHLKREGSLQSLPYKLARSLPVVDDSDSVTLPIRLIGRKSDEIPARSLPVVDDSESVTLPIRLIERKADEIPGFVGFHVEEDKKRDLVDEWLGDEDANAPVHASDNSRRSLPTVNEDESMGTLPVADFAKRDQVDEWLQDEDPNAPVHASRSLPVVDESESLGTLPVVGKRDFPKSEVVSDAITLPILHRERPTLVGRSFEMQLENRSDVAYYAQLNIGTPPQQVYAQLDTGSFELWVNPDCTKLQGGDKTFCEAVGEYDPSKSKTSTETGQAKQLNYGIGSAQIDYVLDDISLSDTIKLEQVQFGVATGTKDQFAGVLGIGYGNRAVAKYDNFIDNLAKQGAIKTRTYGIALGSKAEGAGVISFGALDTSKYAGDLVPLSVIPPAQSPDKVPRFWVDMKSASLTDANGKNKKWANSGIPVFLDTGATLTLLPPDLARSIAADFGSTTLDAQGFYTVDCDYINKEGTVDFEFEGITINVPFTEIIRQVRVSPPSCYLGIVPSERFALLGDTFMRSVYAVFDHDAETIHLAQYKNCGSSLKTINKSSDIQGMTGSCDASDDDDDKDDKPKDGKPKDDDKDEDKPKTSTQAPKPVTTFVTTASGSATTVTKSAESTTSTDTTSTGTTSTDTTSADTTSAGTTKTSSPSSTPEAGSETSDDSSSSPASEASSEPSSDGGDGGSGAGALAPLGMLFTAGVGFAMLLML